jgi:GlpG protein
VEEFLSRWQRGEQLDSSELLPEARGSNSAQFTSTVVLARLATAPVTALTIVCGVIGLLLIKLPLDFTAPVLNALLFFPVDATGRAFMYVSISEVFASGELWRVVTPIFIHFGYLHIVFNGLWVWVFGEKIEHECGSLTMATAVFITGLAGNILQAWVIEPSFFGGLSGSVYGLLGFIWIWQLRVPKSSLRLPNAMIVVMIAFLVLGYTGILNVFSSGKVANAAHLGGLLAGMGLGGILSQWHMTARKYRS